MQPRDTQRLEHILDYCEDIENRLSRPGSTFESFQSEQDFQYSIAFCILQIGELAGKLSDELREETTEEMPWSKIRGIRNIVVHDYGSIDLEILWDVANNDIPALKTFCERLLDE